MFTYPIKVAVVVPAYNAARTIRQCLESLVAQTFEDLDLEIIVVDDGSTDNTGEVVNQFVPGYNVRLIRIAHAGAARARNQGVLASGESTAIILFTDADCVPAASWAERITARLEKAAPEVAGIKGIYKTRQTSPVARFVQTEFEERYERFEREKTEIDFCDTYSAAYRREVLVQHPFDENLPGAVVEDAELGWRLRRYNYRFCFEPTAVVYHSHPATIKAYFWRKFKIGRWRVRLYLDYPGQLGGDSHTSQAAKFQMLLTAIALLALTGLTGRTKLARLSRLGLIFTEGILQYTFLPILSRTWSKDPTQLAATWVLLQVRALALGSGAAWGLVQIMPRLLWLKLFGRSPAQAQPPAPALHSSNRAV